MTSARPAGVEVTDFGFRYVSRDADALRSVSLRIRPGERVLLTGRSGSGKSTLLTAIAGLLGPDEGDVAGSVLVGDRPATESRDRIGIVFQDPDSQLVMTRAGDDVAFALENRAVPREQIWPAVREVLTTVGFGYPLDRPTFALSGGEKQRLTLAGALVGRPGLLLLDEPTSQLDPDGADLVRDAVARVVADRGCTLLLVDHDAAPWLPLIDRVLEVCPGGVVEHPPGWTPVPPTTPGDYRDNRQDLRPVRSDEPSSSAVLAGNRQDPGPAGSGDYRDNRQGVVLAAYGVGFSYPRTMRPALAPTDVVLHAGSVLAITGANGAGKSTLGLILAGLVAPSVGRVVPAPEVVGELGDRPPHRWRARDLVTRIGTVFQNPEHQFLTGRVRDELSLGPLRAGTGAGDAHRRARELLARLGLAEFADANPFTLSGGQQRRLSVATALATRPPILILDEPTFGQDPLTWTELVALLAESRGAGTALCVITHDRRLVAALADAELRLGHTATGEE